MASNIKLLTYREFECRYLDSWFQRYFVVRLGNSVDSLSQYTEPIGSYRDRRVESLPLESRLAFMDLYRKYSVFGMSMTMFEFQKFSSQFAIKTPLEINEFKEKINGQFPEFIQLKSEHYRGVLDELCRCIDGVTGEFNIVFGGDIFKNRS